jgi:phospholipid/cholesterol/gamma-HCH transport system ATP-binding protein
VIEVQQVSKRFRDQAVLEGLDLSIARGEVWGLVGPAASGKSVLLKLLCGLLPPDSGSVRVAGRDLGALDERALQAVRSRIGMLFQNNALFDFMNVLENVAFPLLRAGVPREEAEGRAAARLRSVGLAGSEGKAPSQLSGGMKKRVAIARASVAGPELCIYDEPTAGLDPVTTSKIYDLLRADQEATGGAVLVVSSDVEALRRFVRRMAMLYRGRLRYDGPADVIADSSDPVVRQFVRGELEGPL